MNVAIINIISKIRSIIFNFLVNNKYIKKKLYINPPSSPNICTVVLFILYIYSHIYIFFIIKIELYIYNIKYGT